MDALELLRVDHRRISNLIQEVENELNPQTGQAAAQSFDRLSSAVRSHEQMLHRHLYPELEPYDTLSDYLASDATNERQINELLRSIENNQPPEQSWTSRLGELRELWQTHVEQSENRLFPEALRLLGATRLQQLAFDMDAVRTHQSNIDSAIYPASRLGPKT